LIEQRLEKAPRVDDDDDERAVSRILLTATRA
jgi:hypothetical protein